MNVEGSTIAGKDDLLDALVVVAFGDPRIRALWIEADAPNSLRRPYGDVTIHLLADEPDFQDLVASWEGKLSRLVKLRRGLWTDTERLARQLDVQVDLRHSSPTLRFILECSAFLAKRPRKKVVALVDKTNHLIHCMDFSKE